METGSSKQAGIVDYKLGVSHEYDMTAKKGNAVWASISKTNSSYCVEQLSL